MLEQEGLYLASKNASIEVEEVYQEEVHHLLDEQPFVFFCNSRIKVLASAAGNFFAKRKRLKASRFLPPLPKALENNFKEEHPPRPCSECKTSHCRESNQTNEMGERHLWSFVAQTNSWVTVSRLIKCYFVLTNWACVKASGFVCVAESLHSLMVTA